MGDFAASQRRAKKSCWVKGTYRFSVLQESVSFQVVVGPHVSGGGFAVQLDDNLVLKGSIDEGVVLSHSDGDELQNR